MIAGNERLLKETILTLEQAQAEVQKQPLSAKTHYDLGTIYQSKGDYINAIECFNKATQLDPKCAPAWYNLGVCLQNINLFHPQNVKDNIAAFECFQKATVADPKFAPAWGNLGICYNFGIGTSFNLIEAFECFQKATVADPKFAHAWHYLGTCHEYGKGTPVNRNEASRCYLIAYTLNSTLSAPSVPSPFRSEPGAVGKVLTNVVQDNDYFRKRKAFLEIENTLLQKENAFKERRKQFLMNNRDVEMTDSRDLKRKHPDNDQDNQARDPRYANAWYALGVCHEKGFGTPVNLDEAFKCYQKAAEADPKHAQAWFKLGACHELGNGTRVSRKAAFKYYQKATEADAKHAEAWFKLGACHELGKGTGVSCKAAFKCYQKAAEADPKHVEAWLKLAARYESGIGIQHNYKEAFKCYQIVTKADPKHAIAWFKLATCHEWGHWGHLTIPPNEAFKCYQKVTEADPKHAEAWYRLGWHHEVGSGTPVNPNEALKCYEEAIKVDSNDVNAFQPVKADNLLNSGQRTRLHEVVANNQIVALKAFLAAGADCGVQQVGTGFTPLHAAMRAGRKMIVEALLDGGADRTVKCSKAWPRMRELTPSEMAREDGHEELADALNSRRKIA